MADKVFLFLLISVIIGFFIVILIPTGAVYCPQNSEKGLTCIKTYKFGWCTGIEGFYCPPGYISPLTSTDYYICKDGLWNYCGSSCDMCAGKPLESCSYTSCIDCTASSYCGWCKPLGQCLLGTKSGAGDGICSGNDWIWTTKNCFGYQTTTTSTRSTTTSTTTTTITPTSTTTIPPGDNKYNIVFVPLYYSPDEHENAIFIHETMGAFYHWLMRSPFKECPDPFSKFNLYFVDSKDCQKTCSDICRDCQDKVKDCVFNSKYRGKWNKIVGICKGESCKGLLGTCGCSDDIPSDTSVTNIGSSCNGDPGYQIVAHEMGHSFGLCHVSGCGTLGGCKEEAWCPNKDDCYVPKHEDFIMDYCSPMEKYGPAGYQFLKSEVFKDYLAGC